MDGYHKAGDWGGEQNPTITYSEGGPIRSSAGAITANYWLSEI